MRWKKHNIGITQDVVEWLKNDRRSKVFNQTSNLWLQPNDKRNDSKGVAPSSEQNIESWYDAIAVKKSLNGTGIRKWVQTIEKEMITKTKGEFKTRFGAWFRSFLRIQIGTAMAIMIFGCRLQWWRLRWVVSSKVIWSKWMNQWNSN